MSTSIDWRASRAAATSTTTATTSAAIASAFGSPAATKIRPTMTASVPAKSLAKCRAFEASAAEWNRREARKLADRADGVDDDDHAEHRERPPRGLDLGASSLEQAARRPASPRNAETAMRNVLSPSAARCSALPWP